MTFLQTSHIDPHKRQLNISMVENTRGRHERLIFPQNPDGRYANHQQQCLAFYQIMLNQEEKQKQLNQKLKSETQENFLAYQIKIKAIKKTLQKEIKQTKRIYKKNKKERDIQLKNLVKKKNQEIIRESREYHEFSDPIVLQYHQEQIRLQQENIWLQSQTPINYSEWQTTRQNEFSSAFLRGALNYRIGGTKFVVSKCKSTSRDLFFKVKKIRFRPSGRVTITTDTRGIAFEKWLETEEIPKKNDQQKTISKKKTKATKMVTESVIKIDPVNNFTQPNYYFTRQVHQAIQFSQQRQDSYAIGGSLSLIWFVFAMYCYNWFGKMKKKYQNNFSHSKKNWESVELFWSDEGFID